MNVDRIRLHLTRRPWIPMDLVLDNGERIQVRHPEAVFFIADWEIVVVDDGRAYFIGPEAVSMIVRSRSRRRKSPTR